MENHYRLFGLFCMLTLLGRNMRSIGGSLTAVEVGNFIYILFGVGLTCDGIDKCWILHMVRYFHSKVCKKKIVLNITKFKVCTSACFSVYI